MTLLLHRWCDAPTRDPRGTSSTARSHGMARGGVYDQLGGGFHRYSVDAEWIVPHFEKMSYDNSELLKVYIDAYAPLRHRGVRRRRPGDRALGARGAGRSGRAATQRARMPMSGLDDDGDYFTWTRDEAAAVLAPDELEVAAAYYDIGTAGEMHHNPRRTCSSSRRARADIAGASGAGVRGPERSSTRARAEAPGRAGAAGPPSSIAPATPTGTR